MLAGRELKETILGEIGLTPGLQGSTLCREARIAAADELPNTVARHVWAFDAICCPPYANGLFKFASDVARYGDIGMTEMDNTLAVITDILDLLVDDLYFDKSNHYRQQQCKLLLLKLTHCHTLLVPPLAALTDIRECCTVP